METMQIPSFGWSNPAAATQQSASSQRLGPAYVPHPGSAIAAPQEATAAGDRDANERYEGPDSQSQHSDPSPQPPPSEEGPIQLLELPADDGVDSSFETLG